MPSRRTRSSHRHPVRRVVLAALLVAAVDLLWEAWTWPNVAALAHRNPPTTAFIELWRREQRAASRSDAVSWRWVSYGAISGNLKRAVLVSEDINFFSHHGFELHEMKAAIEQAAAEGELPRGASTITQQVAKNLWLSSSRSPLRKIKEAILTWQLERALGKRRILEIYLDVAEFGDGVYGAEAAARRYYGISAADLDEEQAARLAACLPNPHAWHPGGTSYAARRRASRILERMRKAQFLGKEI